MTTAAMPYAARVSELSEPPRPALAVVANEVPDDQLTIDQLGSRIVGMSGRLASAMCRWLLLVAEFDARNGAGKFCLATTARWLGHYCGLSPRTAREHVRAARVLARREVLAKAFGAGRISYSHVRAIARVADLGGDRLIGDLVMVAEHGTVGQLEELVRGLRTVDRNNSAGGAAAAEELSYRWREDSQLGLSVKLDPEHGALVLSAIDTVARREGITHAQALTRIAEIALAAVNAGDQPAPSLRADEYAAIVINLDAAQLPPDQAQPVVEGGSAEPQALPAGRIAGGPGLPDAALRRLLCGSRIRAVVTTDDASGDPDGNCRGTGRFRRRANVLDVGANRRLVSDKQFRALMIRDSGCCVVPGCGSAIGLEAHHVQHWYWGGKTTLANLVLLCRAHHHALHDDDLRITADGNGRFRCFRPDGRQLPDHSNPAALTPTARPIEDDHCHVESTAATTRWDGSPLDRRYAIACLARDLTGGRP